MIRRLGRGLTWARAGDLLLDGVIEQVPSVQHRHRRRQRHCRYRLISWPERLTWTNYSDVTAPKWSNSSPIALCSFALPARKHPN